jgi:hypothetical protein
MLIACLLPIKWFSNWLSQLYTYLFTFHVACYQLLTDEKLSWLKTTQRGNEHMDKKIFTNIIPI